MKTLTETLQMILEDEKEDWFIKRTNRHIDLVRKYCKKIYDLDPKRFPTIIQQGSIHDASKFKAPEKDAYVHVNWHYKMKDAGKTYDVSPEMQDAMHKATLHHIKNNPHHVEFHTSQENVLNKDMKDRDKAVAVLIDGTKMPDKYIAEMCADWSAMSEEKGTTPKDWADKMVNKKWKFTESQVKLIYELIDNIWY